MNALSKLFETLHLSRRESASRRSHRRRRTRQQESTLSCETLESKQLLAADVAVQFSDQVLETTDPITVALEGKFEESEVSGGTIVKFETNAPLSDNDFFVELTDNTPQTNANFLSYVNNGDYDNSIFHRSVPGFALQGGGYTAPQVKADLPGSDPNPISSSDTVQNEPGNLNTRGTIAMAKLAGQPDSATSQFFFNLSDNEYLNSDNGGYTVFGEVIGSGMTVVDTMASAPTYLADAYYANTAFKELPLYNLNADNIVQPDDFVKIENVDVVTASTDLDLFTYQVTSSDAAKLTASVDGNGNLVLTPDSSATGSVDVTVTATSRLDTTSSAEQTFSVQLNGGPVLTAIESSGNTFLNQDEDGKLYAGSAPITNGATHITEKQFTDRGWTPMAVEDFGNSGGKQFLLQHITGALVTWQLNDSFQRTGNLPLVEASDTVLYDAAKTKWGMPELGPSITTLESNGVSQLQVDSDGRLYVNSKLIQQGNAPATRQNFQNNGYEPVAAEDFGENGGKQLAIRHVATNTLLYWVCDASWKRVSNNPNVDSSNKELFNLEEEKFGVDVDQDGDVGLYALETAGTTKLQRDYAGKLYAGTNLITYGLAPATVDFFTSRSYSIVGVEDLGENGGKQLVVKHSTDVLVTWQLDASWKRSSNLPNISPTDRIEYATKEGLMATDIDEDGDIGIYAKEEVGSIELNVDYQGFLYANENPIRLNGVQVTEQRFTDSGYSLAAVEDFGVNGGKQFVVKHNTGVLVTWVLDDSWNRVSNLPNVGTNDLEFNEFETRFNMDFNDDGAAGLQSIESQGNTTLLIDNQMRLYVGGLPIFRGNGFVTQTYFTDRNWSAVAAEDLGDAEGGKQLLLLHESGAVSSWVFDASWKRVASTPTINADDTSALMDIESKFGVTLVG